MESEDYEAVAAASDALSRTMDEHVPANRRPEDVMAEMVERVGNGSEAAPRRVGSGIELQVSPIRTFDTYALTDHGNSGAESLMRPAMGIQPLTPPEGLAG